MMKAERYREIEELYHEALERTPDERRNFLEQACGDDLALRREVESLLGYDERAAQFIETPPDDVAAAMLADEQKQSRLGRTIGHYQIVSLVGAGGMGEVYLAEDTRLKRRVALKLLPGEFTADPNRVRRFEQEARAASALNHPNIITIHEIGQIDETHYMVTEFIDGETLRERLSQGRMELSPALEVILQVASALAAAHEAGIVHRDIKPENIMLRRDGLVKVLDFGLAKLTETAVRSASEEASTAFKLSTEAGVVMGTACYMSPEQARGQKVDGRSDIFSLGVVTYEMVAGRAPFEGATTTDVLASILKTEPLPLGRVAPAVPETLEWIVTKALVKEREERYQTAREMLNDLKRLRSRLEVEAELERSREPISSGGAAGSGMGRVETAQEAMAPAGAGATARTTSSAEYLIGEIKRHQRGALLVLAILVVIVAGLAFGLYKFISQNQSPSRASGPAPRIVPFTSFPGNECCPTFSPDGNQIAFTWNGENRENANIYVKLIDAGLPLRLTNNPAAESTPAWSPDGRYIAFIRSSKDEKGMFIIPALGGPERAIYSVTSADAALSPGLSWSPDGKLLAFSEQGSAQEPFGIFLLSVESLEKRRLTSPPAGNYGDFAPTFSPDGKTLAFYRGTSSVSVSEIYLVPATGGEPKRLANADRAAIGRRGGLAWTPDGSEIVFGGSGDSFWRISIAGGVPERLAAIGNNVFWPAISRQGNRLAYTQDKEDTNIWRFEVPGSTGRASSPTKLIASTLQEMSPQYSADGKRIVFVSDRSGSNEIWVCASDASNPIQLTSFGGPEVGTPRWSPDGRQIAFDSPVEGHRDIYVVSTGGGKPRRLTVEPPGNVRPSWSRDGRWIYFGSYRSGDWQEWKMPAAGGPAVQVTKRGGREAFESPDGKFLYYTKGSELTSIWRTPVDGGEEIQVLDQVRQGYWAVLEQGIYFLNTKATPYSTVESYFLNTTATPHSTIEFFSFATGRTSQIAVVEKELRLAPPGFAVSPDGRWILLAQVDQRESDIMLMENFR
jgi:eukaryotic-like serine/threonine-protein kinase